MSTFKLNEILARLGQGDTLVLGELPDALAGKSAREVLAFGHEVKPLIADRPETVSAVESILADARREALRQPEPALVQPMGEPSILDGLHFHMEQRRAIERSLMRPSKLGLHKGECRVDRPVITAQQKGQSLFVVDGVEVYAGSQKAALKKVKKLKAQHRGNR